MTFFFGGMDSILGHRTARQRDRLSHTLSRLCEARNEAAMQYVGGGSADTPAAPRAPRRTRASSRKPASSDSDGEPAPARRTFEPFFLDLEGVADAVALSTRGVQRLVQAGGFPKPRAISGRRVAWLVEEVREWARNAPVAEMLPPPSGASA